MMWLSFNLGDIFYFHLQLGYEMVFPFIINPIRIEINSFLIKPKLKSTLELNPISLLPLHQSHLSLNLIITAKTRVSSFN